LLNRIRFKIEERTKQLRNLRWNWNTLISMVRLFEQEISNLWIYFFWKIVKINFKNESFKLFFQENVLFAWKTRLSITFTSLVHMEWIKVFCIDKMQSMKLKRKKNLYQVFSRCAHWTKIWAYYAIVFALGHKLTKKFISPES